MPETALATQAENEALLGFPEMTPTSSIDFPGGLVGAFPIRYLYRPDVDVRSLDAPWELCRTSIAPLSDLVDYLRRIIDSVHQTLFQSSYFWNTPQVAVLPISAPSEGIVDYHLWTTDYAVTTKTPSQVALAAVADIQQWLAVGQDEVARIAGYAPRSAKNWRDGMDPYPATVRRLFDIHALLGSLTQRIGIEGARLWLADISQRGIRRRDLIEDENGLRTVVSEAASMLFVLPSVGSSLVFEDEVTPNVPTQLDRSVEPVRRARRRV